MGMGLLGRLLQLAALLAALSLALFWLLHAMPGNTEDMLLAASPELRAEDLDRLRSLRGLDRPLLERYGCWLTGRGTSAGPDAAAHTCAYWPSERGILGGDLGWSRVHKLPVRAILSARVPRTLTLTVPAFLIALLLAIPLGVWAAQRHARWPDHLLRAVSFIGVSLPMHWLAMIAILLFSLRLRLLPTSGVTDLSDPSLRSVIRHAILPVAILTLFFAARWIRYLRSAVLECLHLDFVRMARAKGLSERQVLWRHAFPNAAIPFITIVSQSIPALFSGALVIERVFAYPGVGLLLYESVEANDHLVAIVVFLVYAALTMAAAWFADLVYVALDPRVRLGVPLEPRGSATDPRAGA